jgi:transposase, IS5 family
VALITPHAPVAKTGCPMFDLAMMRRTHGLLLKSAAVVDATLIAAPSSTKNKGGERDPEIHQVKKGNQWRFRMKAHIGVDADFGLAHSVISTATIVNDATQGLALLLGEE